MTKECDCEVINSHTNMTNDTDDINHVIHADTPRNKKARTYKYELKDGGGSTLDSHVFTKWSS